MSICAPTRLLISTGPLSATRCQRCSMTAISGSQATSPGKVLTVNTLSWGGGKKEGSGAGETSLLLFGIMCAWLLHRVLHHLVSVSACCPSIQRLVFLWTSHAVTMTLSSATHPIMENPEAPWGFSVHLESCVQSQAVISDWNQLFCMWHWRTSTFVLTLFATSLYSLQPHAFQTCFPFQRNAFKAAC